MNYIPKEVNYSKEIIEYFIEKTVRPDFIDNEKLKSDPIFVKAFNKKKKKQEEEIKALEGTRTTILKKIKSDLLRKNHYSNNFDKYGIPSLLFQDEGFVENLIHLYKRGVPEIPKNSNLNKKSALYIAEKDANITNHPPTMIFQYPEAIKIILKKSPRFISYIPRHLLKLEIVKIAVEGRPSAYELVPYELKSDEQLLLSVIKSWDPFRAQRLHRSESLVLIELIDKPFLEKREIVAAIVQADPFSLDFLPAKFENEIYFKNLIKNKRINVLRFLKNSLNRTRIGHRLPNFDFRKEAYEEFNEDLEIMSVLIENGRLDIEKVGEVLKKNEKFLYRMMTYHPTSILKIYKDIAKNRKHVKKFISIYPQSLDGIELIDFKHDRGMNLLAAQSAGKKNQNIKFAGNLYHNYDKSLSSKTISNQFYGDKEIMRLAITNSPYYAFFADSKMLKEDNKLNFLAIEKRRKSLDDYARNMERMKKFKRTSFSNTPEYLVDNEEAANIAIESFPPLLHQFSSRVKSNREIVKKYLRLWKINQVFIEDSFLEMKRGHKKIEKKYASNPLYQLPEKYRNDKEIVLMALEITPAAYKEVGFILLSDPDLEPFKKRYELMKNK
jgi:hypothetical protein